jgi:hypothetical protein
MRQWLTTNGYSGRHTPQQLVEHHTAAVAGRDSGSTTDAGGLLVLALVELLITIRSEQTALETRIREALLAHPDGPIFRSLPRACTIRAATLGRNPLALLDEPCP